MTPLSRTASARGRAPGRRMSATTPSCSSTATAATSSTATGTGAWRPSSPTSTSDATRFHVAIENWQHDLNIGSIVRSANAFLAESVHIVGRRRWNKRGAMVTDRYQHVRPPRGCRRPRRVGARARAADRRRRQCRGQREPGVRRTAGALRAAVRPGRAGALRRGARRGIPVGGDHAVRLDAQHQRGGRGGDRHVRMVASAPAGRLRRDPRPPTDGVDRCPQS